MTNFQNVQLSHYRSTIHLLLPVATFKEVLLDNFMKSFAEANRNGKATKEQMRTFIQEGRKQRPLQRLRNRLGWRTAALFATQGARAQLPPPRNSLCTNFRSDAASSMSPSFFVGVQHTWLNSD
ncbi:hypothetical protein CDAR_616061 [Caerostris darwini]|uniref:Uncharacterized protein n=1 Tax=Caerostris darwini TaxID=1538125 RepID=A0AAV4RWG2_9ARAC|nr:hypothetical protein CDAR_616061 [Caerostris darwini]